MTEEQWTELRSRLPVGTAVTGTVLRKEVFGVFGKLDAVSAEHTALLQVIAFRSAKQRPMKFPDDYPEIGSQIDITVAFYSDTLIGKIRLTQLDDDPLMGQ